MSVNNGMTYVENLALNVTRLFYTISNECDLQHLRKKIIRTHLQKPWQDKRFLCNLALKVLAVERLVRVA